MLADTNKALLTISASQKSSMNLNRSCLAELTFINLEKIPMPVYISECDDAGYLVSNSELDVFGQGETVDLALTDFHQACTELLELLEGDKDNLSREMMKQRTILSRYLG